MAEPVIHHPNRDTPESKTARAIVVGLLAASAGLVLVITVGGWSTLQGAQLFAFAYVAVNLIFAYYVTRWQRGVLPVAAALAVLYGVLAAVAGPTWFARDKPGLAEPALDPALLGLLTFVLVPVQLLLLFFCSYAFRQRWNVEIEVDPDDPHHGHPVAHGDESGPQPPQTGEGGGRPRPLGA